MCHGKELLKKAANEINIELTDLQIDQFYKYYEMLVEKNKVMNLTAIVDEDEVIIKHFIDSILSVKVFDFNKIDSLIDVGTGAGFPGIPLKIIFPELNITLVDSLNKRLNFIKEVIDELKLEKITLVHGRAEDVARDKNHREKYDVCVSRAVANLCTLSEYCIPFVKVDGKFISYKSSFSDEEIESAKYAIKVLGGEIISKEEEHLPESDIDRIFINIKKIKNTPKAYPRKAGTPNRKPLKK